MDKFLDWSIFQERETFALTDEFLSPGAEITAALRAAHVKLVSKQQALQELEQNSFAEIALLAVRAVQFGKLLAENADAFIAPADEKQEKIRKRIYKSLQINQKQMLDALEKAGLQIEIPLHKTYTEVAEDVEVEEWRQDQDLTEEIVVEVLEPIIRKGKLMRAGRVIIGTPPSAHFPQSPVPLKRTKDGDEAHEKAID